MVVGGTQQGARPPDSQPQSLSWCLPPLIGCGRHTDVLSLMIFVTIKLIVVYGSEMQECGGKWRKLIDRETGDF